MREELRHLTRLGLPVVGGQLGMMLLHAVDTLMLGQFTVDDLAAAAELVAALLGFSSVVLPLVVAFLVTLESVAELASVEWATLEWVVSAWVELVSGSAVEWPSVAVSELAEWVIQEWAGSEWVA